MARLARIVIPSVPHHVTQRGNRRQQVFFAISCKYPPHESTLSNFLRRAGLSLLLPAQLRAVRLCRGPFRRGPQFPFVF